MRAELDLGALVQGAVELGSPPWVVHRLSELVDDPRASIGDIAEVIRTDAGLSARLLRLANSAFYSFPGRIETVYRALTLIGTQQLRDLAFATFILTRFRGLQVAGVDPASFWEHGVACGAAARVLAVLRREANPERYFVAGLLHDLGRLVIYEQHPDWAHTALALAEQHPLPLYQVERVAWGAEHAAVGQALLRRWRLPESLVEAVAHHHEPSRSQRFPLEAAVVHVADIVAHVLGFGPSGSPYVPPMDPLAWERLSLPVSALKPLLVQSLRGYRAAAATLLEDGA